jgi:ABC-2 type transport system permease protein
MFSAFRILAVNELLNIFRTPVGWFWILIFPIFFLSIMIFSYGRQGTLGPVTVEVVDQDHSGLAAAYIADIGKVFRPDGSITGEVVQVDPNAPLSPGAIRVVLPAGFAAAVDRGRETTVDVQYDSGTLATQLAARMFSPLTTRFNVEIGDLPTPVKLKFHAATGTTPITFPQYIVTGILVLSMMSAGMNSTCFVIATRREQNTFKLMSTLPVTPSSYLLSLMLARIFVIVPASLLLLFAAVYIYDLDLNLNAASVANSVALSLVGSLAVLSLGLLLASRVATAETANLIATVAYVSLLFLSDLAMPLRNFPHELRLVLSALPTTQYVTALRAILVQGASLGDQWRAIGAILLWSAIFLIAARITFRWHRG